MRYLSLLLFFLIALYSNAQSQSELNKKEYSNFKKADKELNAAYQKILKDYKKDTKFIAKLKKSQNAWIKFRDAEMDAYFPEDNKQVSYGSVFPMCWSILLTDLTKERVKQLMEWVDGIPEGDVCAGSIKYKG